MRAVIQIVLGVLIVFLGYMVYDSIMTPIRFNKEKDVIEKAAIKKMLDIKKAQMAFKEINVRYTGDFDTLINFLKNDSFTIIKAEGMIPDDIYDEFGRKGAEEEALRRGIITREEFKISVKDSLFANYPIDSLRYVPYCDDLEFTMKSDQIDALGTTVQVMELTVLFKDLLRDLDPQLVVNYADMREKITKFKGLKLGSLEEGTLNGNWE